MKWNENNQWFTFAIEIRIKNLSFKTTIIKNSNTVQDGLHGLKWITKVLQLLVNINVYLKYVHCIRNLV